MEHFLTSVVSVIYPTLLIFHKLGKLFWLSLSIETQNIFDLAMSRSVIFSIYDLFIYF